jgi:hypothetical protein
LLIVACLVWALVAYFLGFLKAQNPGYHPLKLTNISDLQKLKTGDLIFTRALKFVSKLQQYFLGSYVNHVAMIYKTPEGELWVWDTNPSVGAYMTRLESFIYDNFHGRAVRPSNPPIGLPVPYITPRTSKSKSNLYIRRLNTPIDNKKILQFLQQNLGRPYSYRFWKSAIEKGFGNIVLFPISWDTNTDSEGMFCTELLAHTLAAGGAIDLSRQCAQSFLPHDFWINSIPWVQNQTLLEPERIFGDVTDIQINYKEYLLDNKYTMWLNGI